MSEKVCIACREAKPLSAYHRDASKKGGVATYCKACACAKTRNWMSNNAARAKQKKAEYRSNHRRELCNAELARRLRDVDAYRQRSRERARLDRLMNPERVRRRQRKYASSHRDQIAAQSREYARRKPEVGALAWARRRARKMAAEGSHTNAEWEAVKKRHGYRCAACKKKSKLTKDHIIPLSRGGSDYICNIQPLCMPCNRAKWDRLEAGVQPTIFDRLAS